MNGTSTGRYVLVTGCSSGIGRGCAIQLARLGWNVMAGVRRQEHGQSLLNEQSSNLTPLILDIASQESVESASDFIAQRVQQRGLAALVNNAGILIPGPLELIKPQQLRQQFEVNVFGTHQLTQILLPLMRLAASRDWPARLVLLSSISGRITPPMFGAYAASKHALEAMGEAWRVELKPCNIAVSVVQPDSVATPIWDKACSNIESSSDGVDKEAEQLYATKIRKTRKQSLSYKRSGLATEVVVRSIVHSLTHRRPQPYYRVGWRTTMAFLAHSLLPTAWMDFALRKSVSD